MKNKIAFWIITLLLTACVIFISITTIIRPVFTKNPLPKATVRNNSEEKKKVGKDEIINPGEDTATPNETISNGKDSQNRLLELKRKENWLRSRLVLAT